MSAAPSPAALAQAYEAIRAQATGERADSTPRGLALFLAAGLPAWLHAWTPLAPATAPATRTARELPAALGRDVVRLLTEMALGREWRLATT